MIANRPFALVLNGGYQSHLFERMAIEIIVCNDYNKPNRPRLKLGRLRQSFSTI